MWKFPLLTVGLVGMSFTLSHGGDREARTLASLSPEMNCDFVILAKNSRSSDVYVDLLTSKVVNTSGIATARRLNIQNHRLAPGATMSRSYTAGGRCTAKRQWSIYYRTSPDGSQRYVLQDTDADTRRNSAGDRVVQLYDAADWRHRYSAKP